MPDIARIMMFSPTIFAAPFLSGLFSSRRRMRVSDACDRRARTDDKTKRHNAKTIREFLNGRTHVMTSDTHEQNQETEKSHTVVWTDEKGNISMEVRKIQNDQPKDTCQEDASLAPPERGEYLPEMPDSVLRALPHFAASLNAVARSGRRFTIAQIYRALLGEVTRDLENADTIRHAEIGRPGTCASDDNRECCVFRVYIGECDRPHSTHVTFDDAHDTLERLMRHHTHVRIERETCPHYGKSVTLPVSTGVGTVSTSPSESESPALIDRNDDHNSIVAKHDPNITCINRPSEPSERQEQDDPDVLFPGMMECLHKQIEAMPDVKHLMNFCAVVNRLGIAHVWQPIERLITPLVQFGLLRVVEVPHGIGKRYLCVSDRAVETLARIPLRDYDKMRVALADRHANWVCRTIASRNRDVLCPALSNAKPFDDYDITYRIVSEIAAVDNAFVTKD